MDAISSTHCKYYESLSSYTRSILSIRPTEPIKTSAYSSEKSTKSEHSVAVHQGSMITIYSLHSIRADKKNKEKVSLNQCACTIF